MHKTYESDAGAALKSLKRRLVLDLFLKRGGFWDSVSKVRERWSVAAEVRLPPAVKYGPATLLPSSAPYAQPRLSYCVEMTFAASDDVTDVMIGERREFESRWKSDLDAALADALPVEARKYLGLFCVARGYLLQFMSACALFNPPETGLRQFAVYADVRPSIELSPEGPREKGASWEPVFMELAPIKAMRDPLLEVQNEAAFWADVIEEVGKQHLQPLGIDIRTLIAKVIRDCPDILTRRVERNKQSRQRYYIEVDEHTTGKDVSKAFSTIAAAQQNRQRRTKPPLDPLLGVQAALLYDRYNGPNPEHPDKRRRRWTYPKLARELGLPVQKKQVWKAGCYVEKEVSESAKAYVRLGRRLLKESSTG